MLLMAATLLFAGVFGGTPERTGAFVLFLGAAATWAAQGLTDRSPEAAFLLIDLAVGLGLLVLTIRSKLLWAGAACCAQLLMLAFTATRFLNFPLSELGYLVMLQVCSATVIVALIYGTWSRRWGPKEAAPEFV